MKNTIKEEFQQFSTDLVNKIIQDILLEDMKNLHDSYMQGFEYFGDSFEKTEKKNKKLSKELEDSVNKLSVIRSQVEERITTVDEVVRLLQGEYKNIFSKFSKDIMKLNKNERSLFVDNLHQKHIEHINDLSSQFEHYKNLFIQDVSNAFSKEIIEHNTTRVEEAVHTIDNALKFMNSEYNQVFKEFKKEVGVLNSNERKTFINEIENAMNEKKRELRHEVDSLTKIINSFTKEQKDLFKLIDRNNNKVTEVKNKIDIVRIDQHKESKDNSNRYKDLVDSINHLKEEMKIQITMSRELEEEYKKIARQQSKSNRVMKGMGLFIILLVQPWNEFGDLQLLLLGILIAIGVCTWELIEKKYKFIMNKVYAKFKGDV